MLFTEPSFLFYFLPALLALHALLPRRARNPLLLIASLVFYAWGEPVFVVALGVATLWSWAWALAIERALGDSSGDPSGDSADSADSSDSGRRLADLWTGIAVAGIVGLLAVYKYTGFAVSNLNELLAGVFGLAPIAIEAPALPIGISFFSFQAISYLVDVRTRRARAQRSPLDAALYVSMFPQLIAGPIVRYADVEAQLRERHVSVSDFAYGARRFAIGLGKKILIANSLAVPVDRIFAAAEGQLGLVPGPADVTLALAWLAAVAYALQIYFDFSGYSDMAIGLARMFGFRYRENFAHPYVSGSITEFWRRWHISLSTWFRDYLYLPLGGNRRGAARTHVNLWIVFLLCGIWHGAQWTFVAWGAWHGLLLSLERALLRERISARPAAWRVALTFLAVTLGFVIFRAETLAGAGVVLAALFSGATASTAALPLAELWNYELALVLVCAAIGATPVPAAVGRHVLLLSAAGGPRGGAFAALQAALVAAVFFACATRIAAGTYDPFIYFRF